MTGSRRATSAHSAPLWRAERQVSSHGIPEPTKAELEGELIAFIVRRHEPKFVTQFGVRPKTVASLYVLTGPLSGEWFPEWTVVGPMAVQMAIAQRAK